MFQAIRTAGKWPQAKWLFGCAAFSLGEWSACLGLLSVVGCRLSGRAGGATPGSSLLRKYRQPVNRQPTTKLPQCLRLVPLRSPCHCPVLKPRLHGCPSSGTYRNGVFAGSPRSLGAPAEVWEFNEQVIDSIPSPCRICPRDPASQGPDGQDENIWQWSVVRFLLTVSLHCEDPLGHASTARSAHCPETGENSALVER